MGLNIFTILHLRTKSQNKLITVTIQIAFLRLWPRDGSCYHFLDMNVKINT